MNKVNHQLGIFSWFGFVMPLPERLELINRAGFAATTIWWEDEIGLPGIKKEKMPEMVREAGLILENIHVPYHDIDDLWSESKSLRTKIVNQHIKWLNDCAELGIPVMLMHIVDRKFEKYPNKWGIESISQLLKTAEELGVTIAIENTGSVDYIDFILRELVSDHLVFCYDSSHDFLYSDETALILKKQGHRLKHLHLSDNDRKKDRHWLPGEGKVDWQLLSNTFPRDKYEGNITLEVYPGEQDLKTAPQYFIKKAYRSAFWVRDILTGITENKLLEREL